MNGVEASLAEARELASWLDTHPVGARVAICPPATLICRLAAALAGSGIEVGGQDCSPEHSGAFTGDVSAEMLVDAGANLVILGHSERRQGHGERNADVAAKVRAAIGGGLEPIVCVGESLQERRIGRATGVVTAQVRGSLPLSLSSRAFCVAYEPVWAIGTGLTPSIAEIEAVHLAIRAALGERFGVAGANTPILYGGSVTADNAAEILGARDVGGALVGGASLRLETFSGILSAA
jgi:triosephosphate isomerase